MAERGRPAKWKPEHLLAAIPGSNGNISEVARKAGMQRMTAYKLLRENPELQEALEDERESRVDWVEEQLIDRIRNKDTVAMIFFLKCQGKHRGWVERQEHANANISEIKISVKRDGE